MPFTEITAREMFARLWRGYYYLERLKPCVWQSRMKTKPKHRFKIRQIARDVTLQRFSTYPAWTLCVIWEVLDKELATLFGWFTIERQRIIDSSNAKKHALFKGLIKGDERSILKQNCCWATGSWPPLTSSEFCLNRKNMLHYHNGNGNGNIYNEILPQIQN